MCTHRQFKVTNYPSLEIQLQVKQPHNLVTVVGYLSGEAWKPDFLSCKQATIRKMENSGDISSLPESGEKFHSVWLSKVSGVTNKIFLPPPIQPPHSSALEPCSPSQEHHKRSCCIRALGELADGRTGREHGTGGRDRKGGLGKVSSPGSYCNKVKTAERPGVTFKVSQKRKDSSQRDSLVSI